MRIIRSREGFSPQYAQKGQCLRLREYSSIQGTGSGFSRKSTGAHGRKRLSMNTRRKLVLFLQKSPKISGNLQECTHRRGIASGEARPLKIGIPLRKDDTHKSRSVSMLSLKFLLGNGFVGPESPKYAQKGQCLRLGAKDCTPEIDTSEIIGDFQWHLPMDCNLSSGLFLELSNGFSAAFSNGFQFCEIWCAVIFCPESGSGARALGGGQIITITIVITVTITITITTITIIIIIIIIIITTIIIIYYHYCHYH